MKRALFDCNSLLIGIGKTLNKKLEDANHYGHRTIMNLGRSINYESILRTADMNTLEHRRIEQSLIIFFSIITQVIIEIRALPLVENGVIFRYIHLRGGDYSGRTNFLNGRLAFCRCAIPRNTKQTTKLGMTLLKGKM